MNLAYKAILNSMPWVAMKGKHQGIPRQNKGKRLPPIKKNQLIIPTFAMDDKRIREKLKASF